MKQILLLITVFTLLISCSQSATDVDVTIYLKSGKVLNYKESDIVIKEGNIIIFKENTNKTVVVINFDISTVDSFKVKESVK